MSLTGHGEKDIEATAGWLADLWIGPNASFPFLPGELTTNCRGLIESYHAIHGYAGFSDMLWHSDARDLIENHCDLARVFRSASKSRGAKRANESFLVIATLVVSLEILVRDFAGWGTRHPAPKREAEALMGGRPLSERNWLMDRYLYPQLGPVGEFAGPLASAAKSK
jgi:hypothetical protein